MKRLSRDKLVPPLVRDVDIISTYPGYRHNYFTSFAEIDAYFKDLCGENWKETEWAKFWLRDHWKQTKRDAKNVRPIKYRDKESKEKLKYPLAIIRQLVLYYVKEQGLSLRKTANAIKQDGVHLGYSALSRIMKGHM